MKQLMWQDLAVPMVLTLTGLLVMLFSWTGVVNLDTIRSLWPSSLILIGLAEYGRR